MHRALALLTGLLLAVQVAAQPVAATESYSAGRPNVHQVAPPPPDRPGPGSPSAGDQKTVPPRADMQVELVRGWWVGENRHSLYRGTNIGKGTAKAVHIIGDFELARKECCLGEWFTVVDTVVGDVLPGQSVEHEVICKAKAGWRCYVTSLTASTEYDLNPWNNMAAEQL